MRTLLLKTLPWTLLLSCLMVGIGQGAEPPDSSIIRFKLAHKKKTWEQLASFPGKAIYFPMKYTMKGFNAAIGYIDQSTLIAQINDRLTSDDGRRGVRPTYSPRSGAGVKFYQKGLFGRSDQVNRFELKASHWELARQTYSGSLQKVQLGDRHLSGGVWLSYQKLPTEHFYGIGNTSSFDIESDFSLEQSSARVAICYDPGLGMSFEAEAKYEISRTDAGREPGIPSVTEIIASWKDYSLPGLLETIELTGLTAAWVVDTKDRPGNPTHGFDLVCSGALYQQVDDEVYGFYRYTIDASRYIHLFSDRVLVLRAAAEQNDPLTDRTIPFYQLAELGSKETIRGYRRGRFRDRDKLMGSLEYRYPVWRNWNEHGLDVELFFDIGQVTEDLFKTMEPEQFKKGYGFGFRMWNLEGLALKAEMAWGDDGWRVYFVLN